MLSALFIQTLTYFYHIIWFTAIYHFNIYIYIYISLILSTLYYEYSKLYFTFICVCVRDKINGKRDKSTFTTGLVAIFHSLFMEEWNISTKLIVSIWFIHFSSDFYHFVRFTKIYLFSTHTDTPICYILTFDPAQKYYSKVIHRKEVTHSNGQ